MKHIVNKFKLFNRVDGFEFFSSCRLTFGANGEIGVIVGNIVIFALGTLVVINRIRRGFLGVICRFCFGVGLINSAGKYPVYAALNIWSSGGHHIAESIGSHIVGIGKGILWYGESYHISVKTFFEYGFLSAFNTPFVTHGKEQEITCDKSFTGVHITVGNKSSLFHICKEAHCSLYVFAAEIVYNVVSRNVKGLYACGVGEHHRGPASSGKSYMSFALVYPLFTKLFKGVPVPFACLIKIPWIL